MDKEFAGTGRISRRCKSKSFTDVGNSCVELVGFIMNTRRSNLIDVFIVEGSRTAQGNTEVSVQVVGVPKSSLSTLNFNVIRGQTRIRSSFSVHPKRQHEVGGITKQAPTVIDTRLSQQVKTLSQSGLDTGEPDTSLFSSELLLGGRKESRAS